MSSEPHRDSTERNRLPFEPAKNRKKGTAESKNQPDKSKTQQPKTNTAAQSAVKQESKASTNSPVKTSIPQVVSRRMARRMAIFSGVPTTLGVSTFFVCYWIVSHGWYKLPPVAVLMLSLGWFGLGVLGLSYGVLSASWDEEVPGSKLGWGEFTTNFSRMTAAWRSTGQKS